MREIGIEHLRKDLVGALEDLPFAITRRGVPIAVVQPYGSDKPRLPSSRKQVIKKLKAEVKAIEKDEFNPLKCAQNAPLPIKPFRAETHHRG